MATFLRRRSSIDDIKKKGVAVSKSTAGKLTASVGKGGRNSPKDIEIVEDLLHARGFFGHSGDRRMNIVGAKKNRKNVTIEAITKFQRTFMRSPSGLIQPGSQSERLLTNLSPGKVITESLGSWVAHIVDGAQSRHLKSQNHLNPGIRLMIAARRAYYPPRPSFNTLADSTVENTYGKIRKFEPTVGRFVKVTDHDSKYKIDKVTIPQLAGKKNQMGGVNRTGKVRCHEKAKDKFLRLFQAWEDAGLIDRINDFGGPVAVRYRGQNKSKLSLHSWGIAIDLNVQQNKMNMAPARLGEYGCVLELVPIANSLGWFWGGHFQNTGLDAMHFEIAVP